MHPILQSIEGSALSARHNLVALLYFVSVIMPPGIAAQNPPDEPKAICMHAKPRPNCRAFFLTNAGMYFNLTPKQSASTALRGMVDWGLMVNTGSRIALGVSWFVTLDEDDFTTGPAAHVRFWFTETQSLDVAIGTVAQGGQDQRPGSVLGLVKYNPVHWFGVALRPELVRREQFVPRSTRLSPRLLVGAEVGGVPGAVLSVAGGVTLGVVILALLASAFD